MALRYLTRRIRRCLNPFQENRVKVFEVDRLPISAPENLSQYSALVPLINFMICIDLDNSKTELVWSTGLYEHGL